MLTTRATKVALTLLLVAGLAFASPALAGAQEPAPSPISASSEEGADAGAAESADPEAAADAADAEEGNITGGFLDWGVKQSFRTYIVGPIAQGTITFEGGASQNPDGTFRFPALAEGSFDPSTGSVVASFEGTVHFQGHCNHAGAPGECLLQLSVGNIRVEASSTEGILFADIVSLPLEGGTSDPHAGAEPISYPDAALATLDLTDVSPFAAGSNGAAWLDVPTALAAEGQPAFSTFYTVGTALDPASYTLTLSEEVDLPEPPPTDDEEPGVSLDKTTVAVGEPLTASGEGFMAGEQVEVWVHSTPVWVGTATADAAGAASYTFVVPPEVPPGTHQVELRGISSGLSLWSADFTVVAGGGTGAPVASRGTLPATGPGDLDVPLAAAGLLSLLFGTVLVLTSRRRLRSVS